MYFVIEFVWQFSFYHISSKKSMFLESKIAPFDFLIKVTKKQKERQPKSTLRKTQTPIVAKQI